MITAWLKEPDFLVSRFSEAVLHGTSIEIRQVAAVLFRRYAFTLVDDSVWPRCTPATHVRTENSTPVVDHAQYPNSVQETTKAVLLQALLGYVG